MAKFKIPPTPDRHGTDRRTSRNVLPPAVGSLNLPRGMTQEEQEFQKLPFGANTPLQFLIHHMMQRLLDLGQEVYVRTWLEQLKRAQVTGTFDLHDAIISLREGGNNG